MIPGLLFLTERSGGFALEVVFQMPVHIPKELLGDIVEWLKVTSDWATVASLALVSQDFRFMCQKLLFETLSLTLIPEADGSATRHRLDGFVTSPRLVSYVRGFEIQVKDPLVKEDMSKVHQVKAQRHIPFFRGFHQAPKESIPPPPVNELCWALDYGDLLVKVLQMIHLDQLRALTVHGWERICSQTPCQGDAEQKLRTICEELDGALQRLLQAPLLRRLSATQIPITWFQGCSPSLKDLSATRMGEWDPAPLEPNHSPPLELESFESVMNHSNRVHRLWDAPSLDIHQYLLHPHSPFDLRSLKRLVWENQDRAFEDLQSVLEVCRHSLRHLKLNTSKWATKWMRSAIDPFLPLAEQCRPLSLLTTVTPWVLIALLR
jgi:hypothetical protein